MSPVTNERLEGQVIRQLDDYAESLRTEMPSAALDARMEASIAQWASEQRVRGILHRPLAWVVAAACVAVVSGGIALLAFGDRNDDADVAEALTVPPTTPLPELSPRTAVSPLTTGSQVSLFPADGAVFRVKANLASAVIPTSGQMTKGERQYWVDVRIANDGTMRIMQVLPAEAARVVPRE
jgi:hypothetical protein